MDRIQMNMQLLPNHIKTALKLLTTASPRLIKTLLPITLSNIGRIADVCVQAVNTTIHSYGNLASFLHELVAITIGTETSSKNELDQINESLNNSTVQQDLLNSQLEFIQQEFQAAREALQRAQKEYNEAYHAIPVGLKRGLKKFSKKLKGIVSGAGKLVGGALNSLGCIMSSCGSSSTVVIDNAAFENAKQKAEIALARLKEAQVTYDQWYSQMQEKQNKLTSTIMQLSLLDMSKIDHQTIIQILISATKEIIHIQEQWDKMLRFFAKLAMYAENTKNTIMHEFIAVIEGIEIIGGTLDDADREFYVILLLETAEEIDRGAHLLYVMAKTYFDVSHQYIMNQIAGISGFLVPQTEDERDIQMKKIAQDTQSTSAKISRMAMERQQQYEQRNEDRRLVYEQFIEQVELEELQSSIGK